MASEPRDESRDDSDPDAATPTPRDADEAAASPPTDQDKITPLHGPRDPSGDTAGSDHSGQGWPDDELIEMLEEINEKLDSATSALGEAQSVGPDVPAVPHPAAAEPAPAPAGRSDAPPLRPSMGPLIAVGLGVGLGAIATFLLWPVWTESAPPPGSPVPKKEARLTETVVEKQPVRAAPVAPRPVPEQAEPTAPVPAIAEEKAAVLIKPDLPAPRPSQPPLTAGEETALLARGRALMASGDVASARLVYSHGARRDSAAAMLALARTYDPAFLERSGVIGVPAEPRTALRWYREAAQRGSAEAARRADELAPQMAR